MLDYIHNVSGVDKPQTIDFLHPFVCYIIGWFPGKILELVKPDPNTGKVHTLLTVEIFGVIRTLMSFRLTGGSKDYVVCGTDSGRICILEYIPNKNKFDRVSIWRIECTFPIMMKLRLVI